MSLAVVYSRALAGLEAPLVRVEVQVGAASGQLPAKHLEALEFAGELGLSGELRPIRGALAMTFGAHRDGRAFVVPACVSPPRRRWRAARPSSPRADTRC